MTDRENENKTAEVIDKPSAAAKKELSKRLDTIGWGLFFIWVGIAFIADLGFGIGLLGIGIITIVMILIDIKLGLDIEWFWLIIGILFTLGGFWIMFEPDIPLVPVLMIVAGLLLLLSLFLRPHKDRQ